MQLDFTVSGGLDPHRLREAVQTVVGRHPNLVARFCQQFDEPVQIIPADPAMAWRYVELDGGSDPDEQVQEAVRGGARRGLRAGRSAGHSGGVDPCRGTAAPVGAHQSPHRARWLVAADPAGGDLRRLSAGSGCRRPVAYRRFVSWLADRELELAPARPGVRRWPVLTPRPWWLGRIVWSWARRGVAAFGAWAETTRALSELARAHHTTVNIVLQGAWAQLLMWLTGQHDVAFGTAVSGRPTEVVGAESMVGLLINTVPVRAHITAATTTADLLDQLQSAHNHTLEHQHLALTEIHRVTGHDKLFDTLFVTKTTRSTPPRCGPATSELSITEFAVHEYNHYPLTVQAGPGANLGFASNTTPTCSTRPASRRCSGGCRGAGGDDR